MAERNICVQTDTFVLQNFPHVEDIHEYLTDYLESILQNVSVNVLSFHPEVPDRVLVKLDKKIDSVVAAAEVAKEPFENRNLRLEPAEMMNAVIVQAEHLLTLLTPVFLKLYFQSQFGDGEEIVLKSVQVPESSDIAVHFSDATVTRKVLEHKVHIPLPCEGYKIEVKHCFSNFHGVFLHKGQLLHLTLDRKKDGHSSSQRQTNEASQNTLNDLDEKLQNKAESKIPSNITITGKEDAVREVEASISRRMSLQEVEQKLEEGIIQFHEAHYDVLETFYMYELKDILKSVKYSCIPEEDGTVVLMFRGSFLDVRKVDVELKKMQRTMKSEIIDVTAEFYSWDRTQLIQRLSRLLEDDPIFKRQKSFEKQYKCIIRNHVKRNMLSQATDSSQYQGNDQKGSSSQKNNSKTSKSFQASTNLQLEIKNDGNIVEEHSNVLVCVLTERKKLTTTSVGKAFSELLPNLQDLIDKLPFNKNVAFIKLNNPALHCYSIFFMKLPLYHEFMSNPTQLEKSILDLLGEASLLGAHSVCFPPLGYGQVMKYPINIISSGFFSALKKWALYNPNSNLRKITFLATNIELYEKMIVNGPKYFPPIPQSHGSVGNEDSNEHIGETGFLDINVEIELVHRHSSTYNVRDDWKELLKSIIGSDRARGSPM